MANKKKEITIHSSAVEYLTYVASTGSSSDSFEMRYEDENIWLTQKMMATLYDVSVSAINQHLKRIFEDNELIEESVIKKNLITASDGKSYSTKHYNLQAIIAVGFKVNNERAIRFRKWAGQIVKDYTIQGWTMDKERLKKGYMFTDEYFECQFCNAAQQRVFLTEGWKELACNMEEIMNLAQYVQEHRNISDKAQEIDYYIHFFESVDQFLSGLKDYLPLLGELNGGNLAGMGEVIVRLKADKAEGQASGQELGVPRSSRANTKFYTLLDNLRKLSDYAVWKQSLNDDDTYQNLFQEIKELEVLAEKGGKNQEIGSEISEQYNMLKKSVVG